MAGAQRYHEHFSFATIVIESNKFKVELVPYMYFIKFHIPGHVDYDGSVKFVRYFIFWSTNKFNAVSGGFYYYIFTLFWGLSNNITLYELFANYINAVRH